MNNPTRERKSLIQKLRELAPVGAAGTFVGAIVGGSLYLAQPEFPYEGAALDKFGKKFDTKLSTHGDYDQNGSISPEERAKFFWKFLKDNGLVSINISGPEDSKHFTERNHAGYIYKDGKQVPIKALTNLLDSYN